MRIGQLVNENHFVTTTYFRNGSHLPTTQCACADFTTQRNGGGSREKDLYENFILDTPVPKNYHTNLWR
jgi:hypothetical protein